MTPTVSTTAGAPDPRCIACGIEETCAYHAANASTESTRESRRDITADLGIPADELESAPSVENLRAKSHALAGRERDLAATMAVRRDLARQVDLEPSTSQSRLRQSRTRSKHSSPP